MASDTAEGTKQAPTVANQVKAAAVADRPVIRSSSTKGSNREPVQSAITPA
ncbi:MAG: hypothetical protein U5K84_05310 [Alkalibacterium sp.]|nr:hypothetical protein [Alkalibacterium sp.]